MQLPGHTVSFQSGCAKVLQVLRGLGVLGQAAFLRLFHQFGQVFRAHLLQLFLARNDVHGELFEIHQVALRTWCPASRISFSSCTW